MILKIAKWVNERLTYYIELKDSEVTSHQFPKEWFEDDKDYKGNPNFHGDD
jgi:hypothetical protein